MLAHQIAQLIDFRKAQEFSGLGAIMSGFLQSPADQKVVHASVHLI